MSNSLVDRFVSEAQSFSLQLSPPQLEQFRTYKNLLQDWNRKMNLTAVDDDAGIYFRHFLDSLSVVSCMDFTTINTVADIGAGAGFPGLPLKVVFPHLSVTLIEATQKKCRFLQAVVDACRLENVKIIQERAEKMQKTQKYDIVLARAVAKLPKLAIICKHFIKNNGVFVAYKQENIQKEVEGSENKLKMCGLAIKKVEKTTVFDGNGYLQRSFVIIKQK